MKFEKKQLTEVDKKLIINLFNQPKVKRHMPLAYEEFNEYHYQTFIHAKEKIWKHFGFGPWAYFIENEFAGFGGLQPDEDNIEIALVLLPKFWGAGKILYQDMLQEAFDEHHLSSVTILFPPSRTNIKAILKIGFIEEERLIIDGKEFIRFRLLKNT